MPSGKGKETAKRAQEKETFDAAGLELAKKQLGGETKIYKATIEIVAPGLLHNSAADVLNKLQEKSKRAKKGEKFDWKKASYLDEKGRVWHPAWHVRSALVEAAKQFQIAGKGKKTYHNDARATVFVDPEFIPLRLNGKPVKEPSSIDERVGKTTTGVAKPTFRPLFDPGHQLTFLIYSRFGYVPGSTIRDILIVAGRFNAIGDYRPEFGRFEVVEFDRVDPNDADKILKDILK